MARETQSTRYAVANSWATGLALGMVFLFVVGVEVWAYLNHGPARHGHSGAFYFTVCAMGVVVIVVALWLFGRGVMRYEWDEESIAWRSLFWRTSMRWSEVATLSLASHRGHRVAVLTSVKGRPFKIEYRLITDAFGLNEALREKLGERAKALSPEIDPGATVCQGKTWLLPEGVSVIGAGGRELIDYSEIRYILRDAEFNLYGKKTSESAAISDGTREHLVLNADEQDYHRALACLLARAASAVVIDTAAHHAPSSSHAAYQYHQHKLRNARSVIKTLGTGFFIGLLLLAMIYIVSRLRGKAWIDWRFSLFMVVVICWPDVWRLVRQIMQWYTSTRTLRKLSAELGEAG